MYFVNLAVGIIAGVVVAILVQLATHSIDLGWAAGFSLFVIHRAIFHAADRITEAIKKLR